MLLHSHFLLPRHIVILISVGGLFIFVLIYLFDKVKKKKQIKALNSAIDLQEQERKRIAEDLHDQVGPTLSAIKLKVDAFQSIDSVLQAKEIGTEVNILIDHVMDEIRQTVRNLTPVDFEKNGLVKSIQNFQSHVKRDKINFDFKHEGIEGIPMKLSASLNLYRIIMEMINNSIRHSGCSFIKLMMKVYEKQTVIVYTDDGCGMNKVSFLSSGSGLKNIESRVAAYRGQLNNWNPEEGGPIYHITFENQFILK